MFRTMLRVLSFAEKSIFSPPHQTKRCRNSVQPRMELLEDRCAPAGLWQWDGPPGGGNWSNAAGGLWRFNGQFAPPNTYPGMQGSLFDRVEFNDPFTGSATLDVALHENLESLVFPGAWNDTLTLNHSLGISGPNGSFDLSANATINMANFMGITLLNLGNPQQASNFWKNGKITGGPNSGLTVSGSYLRIMDLPGELGTNLLIMNSPTGNQAIVEMVAMSNNLTLTGVNNIIDVQNGGYLLLRQHIGVPGQENTRGGIVFGPAHENLVAVHVQLGGTLSREDLADPLVLDEVKIGGAVWNHGGTVSILNGSALKITGADQNMNSYWHKAAPGAAPPEPSAKLKVDFSSKITAVASFRIDIGHVEFVAPSGGSNEALIGVGLVFGHEHPTFLTVLNQSSGAPGTIEILGPVTLGVQTTTTLNYHGGNNTADLIHVKNGAFRRDGTLKLLSKDGQKPTQALSFLASSGQVRGITGAFILPIIGNIENATYSQEVVGDNPLYFQVTIQ